MAKKYSKKNWGSLLQIRMSLAEKRSMAKFIRKFNVTQREFLLAVKNELRDRDEIKNGRFY